MTSHLTLLFKHNLNRSFLNYDWTKHLVLFQPIRNVEVTVQIFLVDKNGPPVGLFSYHRLKKVLENTRMLPTADNEGPPLRILHQSEKTLKRRILLCS